uniref:Uncharacterized protein n=1 Tax=Avena sativa TaxID=4498 RepID=A0ACD5XE41_AVESA
MLRSLDDLAKSLCSAASPAAAEPAAVACAHSEIQREISSMDGRTKAVASRHLSAIACHLLASPAAAAAAPDDLFVHIAQDLVPHLASGRPHAVAEATRVLAASPSVAFPVLFKPLTSCLTAPDPRASIAAAAAFCELSAPPADVAPFLPLVPHICNLLTTSRCIWALISVLRVLARLVPLVESSLVVDPVCQLLTRSSDMFLTFQCIRTVLAARPAHGAILAIGKVKEFLSGARDSNLGLLALGMLYPGYANECRDVTALLLNDGFNSNIRREALHLLMEMVDGENIMGIVGMLVSHVAKSDSDPGFADEILGAVLGACARNVYALVMDMDWYVSLLADMARSVHCARGWGDEIARQLVDVGLRVRDARPELVRAAKTLLIDPALLGNHLLCPLLSAAAWVSGEYAEFIKDPVELVEALLQPRTSLLPMSVRAVYIQATHKVITSCCSIYLERSADSNKVLDVGRGSEAATGSGEEQQIVDKDFFSEKSILHMIKLIEAKVGPLFVECNEVEVLERARKLIGFVHLIKETQEYSDNEKFTTAKELVKNMQTVFSKELSPVSVNARSHSDFRSGHRQGKEIEPYLILGTHNDLSLS